MLSPALLLALLLHPFHISFAEAQWNETGNRLNVALRLDPRDLDAALSASTGRRIVLEKESEARAAELLTEYLRDAIFITGSAAEARATEKQAIAARHKRFHWVGFEHELRYVWVYFELERPPGAESLWLTNRVMIEAEPTQINTLQLVRTDPPVAVRTTQAEPTQPLQGTGRNRN